MPIDPRIRLQTIHFTYLLLQVLMILRAVFAGSSRLSEESYFGLFYIGFGIQYRY